MAESVMDYSVQDAHIEGEYKEYLHRPLFDVNLRLYESSRYYRKIVANIIRYMVELFDKKFDDYSEIKGISGANLGIPFNIIAIGRSDDSVLIMVNPKVLKHGGKSKTVKSNCGSLVLGEPIEVVRSTKVKVAYHSVHYRFKRRRGRDFVAAVIHPERKMRLRTKWFKNSEGCTIQHEIDHNNGITILDRQVSNKED
jgi:peptide deformylase